MLSASEYSTPSESDESDLSVVIRSDLPPPAKGPRYRIPPSFQPAYPVPVITIPPSHYVSLWKRYDDPVSPRARSPQPGAGAPYGVPPVTAPVASGSGSLSTEKSNTSFFSDAESSNLWLSDPQEPDMMDVSEPDLIDVGEPGPMNPDGADLMDPAVLFDPLWGEDSRGPFHYPPYAAHDADLASLFPPSVKAVDAYVDFPLEPFQSTHESRPHNVVRAGIIDRSDGSLRPGQPHGIYEAKPDALDARQNYLVGVRFPDEDNGERPALVYDVPLYPSNPVPTPNIQTFPHHSLDVNSDGFKVCGRCRQPILQDDGHHVKNCHKKRGPCHYCGEFSHYAKRCLHWKRDLREQGVDTRRPAVKTFYVS